MDNQLINELTGKPWCCKCNRWGCPGGLQHYTFNAKLKLSKKYASVRANIRDLGKPKLHLLEDIQLDGINTRDYPDFCDAYISYATYKGRELTDSELDWVNEHSDFVYECVIDRLY